MTQHRCAIVICLALAAIPLVAQFSERIDVVAVEVPISVRDRSGKVPADLTKADFEVFEDGVKQEIIGLTYPVALVAAPAQQNNIPSVAVPAHAAAPARFQVVVYVQESMSSTGGLREAMKALVAQSDMLASMGDVEIVSDYPLPHVVLAATHDAAALRAALEKLQKTAFGHEEVRQLRMLYEREKQIPSPLAPVPAVNPAVFAATQEAALVRKRQTAMLDWMTRYDASGGAQRLLLFVSDGYSVEPGNFYWSPTPAVPDDQMPAPGEGPDALSDLRELSSAQQQSNLARNLGARGWTVHTVAPGALNQVSGGSITEQTFLSFTPPPDQKGRMFAEALQPLHMLGEETGGKVTTDLSRLGSDIESFTQRLTLTYQVRRRRDGELHSLQVRALRPGLTVETQKSVISGSADSVVTARATALAMNFGQRGELPVTCIVRPAKTVGGETLDVTVDLAPLAGARQTMKSSTVRVAVGVAPDKKLPFTNVQRFENVDLSERPEWDAQVSLTKRDRAPVAVVAEEVSTGVWGGAPCTTAPLPGTDIAQLPPRWLPLDDALTLARTDKRLVLLYLRGSGGNNKRADEWVTKSSDYSPLGYVYDQLALAYATAGEPILEAHEELGRMRESRRARLLLLDYTGTPLVELPGATGDYPNLALALNDLARQAPTFTSAAELRLEGKTAQGLVKRGYALYDAGIIAAASDAFGRANAAAEKENDREAAQYAALGLARLRMRNNHSRLYAAIAEVTDVAEHAVTPTVAASAWLLVGQARAATKDWKAAADAFGKAYTNAPKPSALAEVARRGLQASGGTTPEDVAGAAGGEVRLIYQHRTVQTGTIAVVATAPASAARVEFFLDQQRVEESTRPPFRARISLGDTLRPHTIRAVAYDAQRKEIGTGTASLNAGNAPLSVAITAPRETDVESAATLEIEPSAPEGSSIAAVDVYWNERKLATLTAPPYRYDLKLPGKHAFGYVRVVARDAAGATAEDAKLFNAAGSAEEVSVDAVEISAVTRERGLTSADFVVKEDGQPVEVELRSTPEDPITVGLVVDTSSSMRPRMMEVEQDANAFINRALRPHDQAFVVAFDDAPRLVQPLTADLQAVRAAVLDVGGSGNTAVWDAIAFGIEQLRGVPGKRALLVFTDGDDNGSRATVAGVIAAAREVGVSVYVFEMERPVRKESGAEDRRLDEIAESTGGAIFAQPSAADLPRLFEQVRDDTRNEYILSWVSHSTKPRGELRRVSIALKRGGEVRAAGAYYPR